MSLKPGKDGRRAFRDEKKNFSTEATEARQFFLQIPDEVGCINASNFLSHSYARLEICSFSGHKIYPGRGKLYVRLDSRVCLLSIHIRIGALSVH